MAGGVLAGAALTAAAGPDRGKKVMQDLTGHATKLPWPNQADGKITVDLN